MMSSLVELNFTYCIACKTCDLLLIIFFKEIWRLYVFCDGFDLQVAIKNLVDNMDVYVLFYVCLRFFCSGFSLFMLSYL